jgi:hypothetical protein
MMSPEELMKISGSGAEGMGQWWNMCLACVKHWVKLLQEI